MATPRVFRQWGEDLPRAQKHKRTQVCLFGDTLL